MDKNNDKAEDSNPYEKDEMAEFNEEPDIPTQKVKNTVKYGTEIGEPPLTVVIQGGSGSGKTTLIRSLIKYYNNQNISNVIGSVTVRTSKNQRLTFYECSNDISSLIDLAKIADVAVVLIDARVGFEMEAFEFISLLKNHGFTNIVGVITHMDEFKKNKGLSKYKRQIKKRFLKDATDKSKLFYLFGIKNHLYIKTQMHMLARYLKVVKPNIPGFRLNHPYLLCDRYDVTFLKSTSDNEEDDVMVSFFGYIRGNHFNKNAHVHINGLGDFALDHIEKMDDPCPIEIVESKGKVKRTLKQKDKCLYAPYCNVNTLEYDRKAGYISIPEKMVTFTKGLKENEELANDEGVKMVRQLQDAKGNIDKNMEDNELELVEGINVKHDESKDIKMNTGNAKKNNVDYKNFKLSNEPMFYDENSDKNLAKELYKTNDEEDNSEGALSYEDTDITGDDIVDTYKCQNESENQFNLEYLIKNCKARFVTGGSYAVEDESSEEEDSKEKGKKEEAPKEQEVPQEEVSPEEKQEMINNQLKPFLNDNATYGIFQLGSYVRIDIKRIKRKYVDHFSPEHPIVLATLSLQEQETQMGFLKIKFTKHLWYPKILKTNDPLILSVGWRKFQTTMAYCTEDKNMRLRLIKYTPKFSSCFAICYGPLMPINIAIVALQNNYDDTTSENFRICGTGDLIEVNSSFNIVKKLKLLGDPEEIYKKTAYIKNMFNSNLEVARYIGAKIQTVSGIRGVIKKQLNSKPEGRFRATFEDKIKKSDVVFLKTWTQVELNKYYNPIVEYDSRPRKYLRTMAQLRKDYGIELKQNVDSEYRDIQREEQVFPNLVINKNLEKNLPFKNKNKVEKTKDDETFHLKKLGLPYKKKLKTYLTEKEKSIYSMLQRLQTLKNIKEKNHKKGEEKYQKEQKEKEEKEAKLRKKRQREKMVKKIKSKNK